MTSNCQVCEIDESLKEKLQKFKLRSKKNIAAIVLKIDSKTKVVVLDEEYEDIEIEELKDELPESQPRYLLLSYVYKRDDGRVSYPFIFIFISPQGCSMELTMMYTGTKLAFQNFAEVTKVFEIRDLEDLTEDFIRSKLALFN